MRNVEFKNKEVKEFYRSLCNTHQGLTSVMLSLLQKNKVMIIDIFSDSYIVYISINFGDEEMCVEIDLLKNKIYLVSQNKEYKEIYDNFPKKHAAPIGFEYQNQDKLIVKRNIFDTTDDGKETYYFDITINGRSYNTIIEDENNNFMEDIFIKKILYTDTKINSIRDLVKVVLEITRNRLLNIKIADSMGSIVVIDKGNITKYQEYRDNKDEYQRIYLENDEFYIEKKVKEVYSDDMTAYIKKLGER